MSSSPVGKRRKLRGRNVIPFCCCTGQGESERTQEEFQPPDSRSCTDVVYLVVFVVFCFLMILIAAFAYVYGNPYRLINGMDSFGNICGTRNDAFGNWTFSGKDMRMKPYVLYFDLGNMEKSTRICVEQCPDRDLRSVSDLQEFYGETGVNLCRYDYEFPETKGKGKDEENEKLFPRLKSNPSINLSHILCPRLPFYSSLAILKRCIPKPTAAITKRFVFNIYAYLNNLNIWKQILGDLAVTWVTVLGLTSVSFVISFLMVILIHYITNLLSHLIMIAACGLSVGLTGFLWWTYADLKSTLDNLPLERQLEESANNEAAFLTYSIIATVFTIILILVTMVLRKRVGIVVQLFRESAAALWAMPCLVLQPFITYLALTGFFCIWLYVVLCLATADIPTKKLQTFPTEAVLSVDSEGSTMMPPRTDLEEDENVTQFLTVVHPDNRTMNLDEISKVSFIEYRDGAWVKYMWWIYIIGLVWISEFILACQQMVIASSVASWYFSRKRTTLKCVIMESIVRLVKYHVGSIALGSAVITMVKVPRLILTFTDRVFRKWEDSWSWVKYVKKACACCLACFENCIRYIHHNAYTVIAIQGVDFCPASRLAFNALVQNALQVAVINSTGDFVLFLAKCITAALTGLIALIIFRSNETLYFYAIPVLLTVVFSYFVAHCVISVFEMAVDTLFLCFCEDHNMNDGTDGKEFYAPETLLKFMTEDAVDAVAPGRRPGYVSKEKNHKAPIELSAIPEEAIPMNTSNNSSA